MPENNHELIIDGCVYPDTVTITLANDNSIGSRDYVSKDLYESVSSANDHWQAENDKLRELCEDMDVTLAKVRLLGNVWMQQNPEHINSIKDRLLELRIEVSE